MFSQFHRIAAAFFVAATVFILAGCVVAIGNSEKSAADEKATARAQSRVPRNAQLVGFGRSLSFRAPEPGMIYLVDATTGELLHASLVEQGVTVSTESGALSIDGQSHIQPGWNPTLKDHEIYFQPTDWISPPSTSAPASTPGSATTPPQPQGE